MTKSPPPPPSSPPPDGAPSPLHTPRPYADVVGMFVAWARAGEIPGAPDEAARIQKFRAERLEERRHLLGLSLAELARDHRRAFWFEVLDRIDDKCEAGIVPREVELALRAVSRFSREVNNGGFHQYFLNSAGDDCALVRRWLPRIGVLDAAALLETAAARFPAGAPPADRAERILALEHVGVRGFVDLDDAFFGLRNVEVRAKEWLLERLGEVDLPAR